MRLVVTGPEDPKVLALDGATYVAFDSQPVKEKGESCRRNTKGPVDTMDM